MGKDVAELVDAEEITFPEVTREDFQAEWLSGLSSRRIRSCLEEVRL